MRHFRIVLLLVLFIAGLSLWVAYFALRQAVIDEDTLFSGLRHDDHHNIIFHQPVTKASDDRDWNRQGHGLIPVHTLSENQESFTAVVEAAVEKKDESLSAVETNNRYTNTTTTITSTNENHHKKPPCFITLSPWKNVGLIQILFLSVQNSYSSHNSRNVNDNGEASNCFIWYVADDPYDVSSSSTSIKINEIRQRLMQPMYDNHIAKDTIHSHHQVNISIVTIDQLSQQLDDFMLDGFYSQVFCMEKLESDISRLLHPFVFKHLSQVYHIPLDQVIYLDSRTDTTFLWNPVTHTYSLIHTDNNKGNVDDIDENKNVQMKIYQHLETNLELYTHLLLQDKYDVSYFHDIPQRFNHFTDGTRIESWMCDHFHDMAQEVDMIDEHTLKPQDSVYPRILFHDIVYKNYFWTDTIPLSSLSSSERATTPYVQLVTFLEWLLNGPYTQAVDMQGNFYLSDIEENIYYQVEDENIAPYPCDSGYVKFKQWFQESDALNNKSWISLELHERVMNKDRFHRQNHDIYHKNASSSEIGLNIFGWHGGLFGVGKTASKMYHAAVSIGIPVNAIAFDPVWNHRFIHPRHLGYPLTRSCSQSVNLIMVNADGTFMPEQQVPLILRQNKYNIGYWEWELSELPDDLMGRVETYDEVWAPSQFIADSITQSHLYDGKTPVRVVPLPLLKEEIDSNSKQNISGTSELWQSLLNKVEHAFIFLVVFDYSSIKERKNPDASILAFLDAFPLAEDKTQKYHLIMKSHHGKRKDLEHLKYIANNDPRIHFLTDILSNEDHYDLQHRADCYVSMHRSEGYGMNILEEMGNGIPVIATNYSGNLAFFPPLQKLFGTCYFPIPYQLIELQESLGPYKKGNYWANPDHNFTVLAMREVVKHDCKERYGNEASNLTMGAFGVTAIGEKLKRILEDMRPSVIEKEMKMTKILLNK